MATQQTDSLNVQAHSVLELEYCTCKLAVTYNRQPWPMHRFVQRYIFRNVRSSLDFCEVALQVRPTLFGPICLQRKDVHAKSLNSWFDMSFVDYLITKRAISKHLNQQCQSIVHCNNWIITNLKNNIKQHCHH